MGAQFENVTAELSTLAREVLDTLEAEELAAGGFISDMEVRAASSFLRPRLPRMIGGLVKKVLTKYENVTAGQLLSTIDDLLREHKAEQEDGL